MPSFFLTGGNSAKMLYKKAKFRRTIGTQLEHSDFFLTDERCVPFGDANSNYSMIIDNLFNNVVIKNFSQMDVDSGNLVLAADRYSSLIPEVVDVILLSMGEDGHIASLFPHMPAVSENRIKVVPVTAPKAPFQRLTITPRVIKSAKQVYVLAFGKEKRRKYEEALLNPEDISSIPARFVLDREWIFDLEDAVKICEKL